MINFVLYHVRIYWYIYGIIFLEEVDETTFTDFIDPRFQYSKVIEKSQYVAEVRKFRSTIDFDSEVLTTTSNSLLNTTFDVFCTTKQTVNVNGHEMDLWMKSWTSEIADIGVRQKLGKVQKNAKYLFFVNQKSRSERNFTKYCVAAVHSPNFDMTLFTGCIIVSLADLSKPIFVCVRLYSIHGNCNDLDVILYDIGGKSLSMSKINEGTREGFQILKKGKYCVNLDLQGTDIDEHINIAEAQYMKHMTDNLLFPELHTYLRLKTSCEDPFQAKEQFLPRDILPDDVQDDPVYALYDAERDDSEVIRLAQSQLMLKGVNPFYKDDKIPEKSKEETQQVFTCGGDNDDDDEDDFSEIEECGKRRSAKDSTPRASARNKAAVTKAAAEKAAAVKAAAEKAATEKAAASKRKESKSKVPSFKASIKKSATALAAGEAAEATEAKKNTECSFSQAEVDSMVAKAAKEAEAKYETSLNKLTAQLELMQQQLNLTHHAEDAEIATSHKKRKNEEHTRRVTESKEVQNISDSNDDDSD